MQKRMRRLAPLGSILAGLLFPMMSACVPVDSSASAIAAPNGSNSANLTSKKATLSEIIFEETVDHTQPEEVYIYTFSGEAEDSVVFFWKKLSEVGYGVSIELIDEQGEVVSETRPSDAPNGDTYLEESEGMTFAFALPNTGEYELRFEVRLSRREPEATLPDVSAHLLRLRRTAGREQLEIVANSLFKSEQFKAAIPVYEQAIQADADAYGAYFWQTYAYGQMLLTSLAYADEIVAIRQATAQKIAAAPDSQEDILALEAVREIFELLAPADKRAVIRNFDNLHRITSALSESEELFENSSNSVFYADSTALLETGAISDFLIENYDFLYYFFLDRRYD